MAADLIVAPEASADLEQAYAWYEEQRCGRCEDFLSRAEACIQGIMGFPEMRAPFLRTYRRELVRKFPFTLFYKYTKDTVVLYGRLPHLPRPGKVAI